MNSWMNMVSFVPQPTLRDFPGGQIQLEFEVLTQPQAN